MATPTQEQIDAFLELDRRGYWKDKDPEVVAELKRRFLGPQEAPGQAEEEVRRIAQPGGSTLEIRPPPPHRWQFFSPDVTLPSGRKASLKEIDIAPPAQVRKFTPDFPKDYPIEKVRGQPAPFEPLTEVISEMGQEQAKALLTYPTLGFQPGETFKSFVEKVSGMPREQQPGFFLSLATTLPLDAAVGGLLGKAIGAVRRLRKGKEVVEETAKATTPAVKGFPTTAKPLFPKTGEKAGALNLDYLNTPQEVKTFIQGIAEKAPAKFKGETIPVEEMIEVAKDIGISEADILAGKLRPLQEIHPVLIAARQVKVKVEEDLAKVQAKLLASNGSEEALKEFTTSLQRGLDIIGEVRKATSESGRALRSMQVAVGSQPYREMALNRLSKDLEGRKVTQEIARRFATINAQDPREVAIFLREMGNAPTLDKVYEGWRNFLLSGTLTPVRNALGNIQAALSRTTERPVATAIETLFRAPLSKLLKGGKAIPKERFFGELPKDLQAQVMGLWQGLKDARLAYNQELPIFGFDKFQEAARPIAIKGPKIKYPNLLPGKKFLKIKETNLGRLIRIPQRLAMAADEPFKAIISKAELTSQAYRIAEKEGLSKAAKTARIAELISSPTEKMTKQAQKAAQHYTFQDPLGPLARIVSQARETIPGLRYIIPFIQVSANIPKFALQRTPLYLPWIAKRVASGSLKGGAISDELAKVAVGTIAATPIMQLILEDKITGQGPLNPGERNVWLKTHQPYSVKVGNTWRQYRGIEPAGTFIGTMADTKEIWHRMDQESAALALGISIAKNLTNSTYMSGLRDVIDAATDPERHGNRLQTRLAGTAVPNILASITRATEPQLYKPKTPLQAIQARLPLIDKTDLPPVLDIWGEPIIREGTVASRLFWPVAKQTLPDDEATKEVSRLGMSIGSPANQVKGVELTQAQFLRYAQDAGRSARAIVTQILGDPDYKEIPDFKKRDVIEAAFRRARLGARQRLFGHYPELVEKYLKTKEEP